ncbi:unnamed protein product [Rangifer tarandus platyrhynchus]|uniref:Uncharacterized protein n=2 Tax=Rangifer tarandus platyrhynchus TaxID=3082113 RepID=A0ABN8ZMQ9_RANTA|nr:unnamed protein product [Rangifer tarandus platyrhynchus]
MVRLAVTSPGAAVWRWSYVEANREAIAGSRRHEQGIGPGWRQKRCRERLDWRAAHYNTIRKPHDGKGWVEVLSSASHLARGGPWPVLMNTSVERRHVLLSHQFPGAEPGPCLSAYCSLIWKAFLSSRHSHPRSKETF